MANTGAPWNIPYVEPTDIPRTYPDDSEDLALAIAAGLSAAGNAGIGSNVVQTVKTSTFSTSSATFTAVTGLTVTITPTSDTSKVLLIADYSLSNESSQKAMARLLRNSTVIYIGDADGSRTRASGYAGAFGGVDLIHVTNVVLDNPETTSAVTYSLELRRGSGGFAHIGRSGTNGNSGDFGLVPSSITAIEVSA